MSVSLLTLFSYGIAAANKPLGSMDIEVTPMESLTMTDGELTDNLSTQNTKGKNADGSSFEATTRSSATVTARWLPHGSNRKTPPDIRRGEKVEIWKYADADKYYWSPLEYDPKLRKRETIILVVSNTDKEDVSGLTDYEYFLEVSTHNKLVHFHTSTSDGEAVGYDIVLNTKASTFQISDTLDNLIFIDSTGKRILLKNGDETSYDLNGVDLFINVPGDMITVVKGRQITKVAGEVGLFADGGYSVQTPKAAFVTPMLVTTEKFESGSDATINGSLTLGGGMKTGAGGAGGGGDININGAVIGNSSATFTGRVKASNID